MDNNEITTNEFKIITQQKGITEKELFKDEEKKSKNEAKKKEKEEKERKEEEKKMLKKEKERKTRLKKEMTQEEKDILFLIMSKLHDMGYDEVQREFAEYYYRIIITEIDEEEHIYIKNGNAKVCGFVVSIIVHYAGPAGWIWKLGRDVVRERKVYPFSYEDTKNNEDSITRAALDILEYRATME